MSIPELAIKEGTYTVFCAETLKNEQQIRNNVHQNFEWSCLEKNNIFGKIYNINTIENRRLTVECCIYISTSKKIG
jgi:hypothetical protein